MKKKLTKLYEIFFLFVFSLTPLLWLKSNQLVLGHDSGFRLNPFNHLYNLFYSWSPISNFGEDWSYFKGFLITQFPEAFFTAVTHSLWWGQELTFIFWFFLMILSMYICINGIFPERKMWFFRIFSSLFYSYNFFILQAWFIVERSKFSVYVALPLGFLVIFNTFKNKYPLLKGTVLFSLIFLFLNGGGNPPVYGGLLLSYVVLLLGLTVFEYRSSRISALLKSVKIGFMFLFGATIINSYWILPQAYLAITSYSSRLSGIGGISAILGWERIISKNASLLNLFRLQGIPDWYDNPLHPYAASFLKNPLLILISFLPLSIIIIGLARFKYLKENIHKKQFLKIMLLVFLIGTIFAGGTHQPLGSIYEFFIAYIPGFTIFRSSYYKFSPALFFSTAILTGYFLQHILQIMTKSKEKYILLCIAVMSLFLIYNYPFFLNNFFVFNPPFATKVSLPAYTTSMFDYVTSKVSPSEKILLLPELMQSIPADSYTWGYWSLDALPRIALSNPIMSSDNNSPAIRAMYEAITDNNEKLFIELAKATGIRKVLWRGDVLLNDHLTTSNDLLGDEKNLSEFRNVKLQKAFGLWKFYSINLPHESLFTTTSQVNFLNTQSNDQYLIAKIISDTGISNTLYTGDEVSKNIPKELVTNNVPLFTDDCSSCNAENIETLKNSLVMPTVRFLPWSKFYPIVNYKENKELKNTQDLPTDRIDLDLSNGNKRLVEIWRMGYKDFNSNTNFYAQQNVIRYEKSIDDAISNLSGLSIVQKNNYLVRVIAYIEFQKQYIQFFNQNKTLKIAINKLLTYMDEKISSLQKELWASPTNEDRKSFVSITHSDNYTAKIMDTIGTNFTLLIGGSEKKPENITLEKGVYPVEVKYDKVSNLLFSESGSDLEGNFSFKKSNPLNYSIANFSYGKNYFIQFTYTLPHKEGRVFFALSQNNNEGKFQGSLKMPFLLSLITDGKEHTVSYYYKPYIGSSIVLLSFFTNDESSIKISRFTVEQDTGTIMYFSEQKNISYISQPVITYNKIDPTQYIVTIKNATNPYMLLFNQAFKSGWKAKIISDNGSNIPETSHIQINGYENGWYLTKKGNYTIKIEYMPQRYFYVGLIISILVFIGMSIYVLKKIIYETKNK